MSKAQKTQATSFLKLASDLGPEEIERLFQESGALRISVVTRDGRNKWRASNEVETTDQIVFVNGRVVVMRNKPGPTKASESPEGHEKGPEDPEVTRSLGGNVRSQALVDSFRERRISFVDNHPLMKEVRAKLSKIRDPVIRMTLEMTAKELVFTEFDREELENSGRETATLARGLLANAKTLSDMWYKHTESQRNFVDLKSSQFQAIFEHILETFRLAMDSSGVSEDQMVTIFAEVTKLIEDEDWVQEANLRQSKVSMQ